MELILRKSNGFDKKEVLKLLKENMEHKFIENFGGFSEKVSEKHYDEIEKTGYSYVLEDEKIVGFFSFYKELNEKNSFVLNNIQIKKEYQNKGLGTKILDFVENKIKKIGGGRIKLLVFKNNGAYNFYKKNDFKEIDFLEKSKTIVMVKKINVNN